MEHFNSIILVEWKLHALVDCAHVHSLTLFPFIILVWWGFNWIPHNMHKWSRCGLRLHDLLNLNVPKDVVWTKIWLFLIRALFVVYLQFNRELDSFVSFHSRRCNYCGLFLNTKIMWFPLMDLVFYVRFFKDWLVVFTTISTMPISFFSDWVLWQFVWYWVHGNQHFLFKKKSSKINSFEWDDIYWILLVSFHFFSFSGN